MKRGAFIAALLALFLGISAWAAESLSAPATTQPASPMVAHKAVIIEVQGEIDPYTRDHLFHNIEEARQLGADTVILNMDSWGGLLTSGLEMSHFIKRQTDLHIICYIRDKGISAGAMIAMACDEIVVSSSASLGDCAPIVFGPDNKLENLSPAERAKAQGPVLTDFDESAERNHHDRLLSEAMVALDHAVYWVQGPEGEGQRKFVNDDEYKTLTAQGWISVPGADCPLVGKDALLTVSSAQALRYGLATEEASSAQDLARRRGYDIIADLTPGLGEHLVRFLSSDLVRSAIITLFFLCIFVIPHAPGHGIAETVGLGALILMVGVPMLTGYAQWWELLIIFIGLGLIAFEILLPGHVFPGVSGAGLVLFGLVLTFVPLSGMGTPEFRFDWTALQGGLISVAAALGLSLLLWFWFSRYLPKMPYFNRLILTATSGGTPALAGAAAAALWPPVGSIGTVVGDLKTGGTAEFYDAALGDRRIVAVVSESGFIVSGTEVVVREISGSKIVVRKRGSGNTPV